MNAHVDLSASKRALLEKMMRGVLPLATRQAFLIKDGKVVWHDAKAATDQQAEDIKRELAAAK